MTLDERQKLARIVYPDFKWFVNGTLSAYGYDCNISSLEDGAVFRVTAGGDRVVFSPSLTGEDWQKEQALDTIGAAFYRLDPYKMDRFIFDPAQSGYIFEFNNGESYIQCDDILEASCRALLAVGK